MGVGPQRRRLEAWAAKSIKCNNLYYRRNHSLVACPPVIPLGTGVTRCRELPSAPSQGEWRHISEHEQCSPIAAPGDLSSIEIIVGSQEALPEHSFCPQRRDTCPHVSAQSVARFGDEHAERSSVHTIARCLQFIGISSPQAQDVHNWRVRHQEKITSRCRWRGGENVDSSLLRRRGAAHGRIACLVQCSR